jgi:hypothetical protein
MVIVVPFKLVGPVGFEPTTPSLKVRYSSQLSYGPVGFTESTNSAVPITCRRLFSAEIAVLQSWWIAGELNPDTRIFSPVHCRYANDP